MSSLIGDWCGCLGEEVLVLGSVKLLSAAVHTTSSTNSQLLPNSTGSESRSVEAAKERGFHKYLKDG
jgi:hypothetical protein